MQIFIHTMQRHTLLAIGLLVLAGVAVTSCKQNYAIAEGDSAKTTARPVVVVQPTVSQEPIPVEASGVLASKTESKLSFKIGGIISSIRADEGQYVQQGQLLAALDLSEINASVVQAQNGVDKAKRDLARVQNLYRDSVATLEQVQDLTTVLEVAKADLQVATFNRKYAEIRAPFSGKVLRRMAERGELAAPGAPAFVLANTTNGAFVMRIGVADRDIVRLALGDTATVRFDAWPGKAFSAEVTELASAADPRTGAFEVELTIANSRYGLRNGFIGKVLLYPSAQAPYYKLSMDALVEGEEALARVFVYDSQAKTAHSITVRPDHIGEDFFTVLAEETRINQPVITIGAAYLSEGSQVTTVKP